MEWGKDLDIGRLRPSPMVVSTYKNFYYRNDK